MQQALLYRMEKVARVRGRLPWGKLLSDVIVIVLIVLGFIVSTLPFVWMAVSSLGGADTVVSVGFNWSQFNPLKWTIKPYLDAWVWAGLSKYAFTSVIYTISATIATVLTATLAGYAFGRLRFPGQDLLFGLVLATTMIPRSVIIIPLFTLLLHVPLVGGNDIFGMGGQGLYNSYAGLIIPGLVSAASIFLCRQFFQTLPSDLEDAARIDGCSELGIWFRVIMPLSWPVVTVVALFEFQVAWNDFLWPLVISASEGLYTIQVGLYTLTYIWTAFSEVEYMSLLMAGSVIAVLPVIVLFIIFQRQFVRGIALTGLK
jgi:multiple sugar transport system permease protein